MATTSDPQIFYPDNFQRVGKISSDLAAMAQSISDRIAEVRGENGVSDWQDLPYPIGAEATKGFGHTMGYKLGPDYVQFRGTWTRSSGKPVWVSGTSNVITALPAAITNRLHANTYFLAPATGTSYVCLRLEHSTGKIIVRGGSRNGTATWLSLDNWEVPLAKVQP